MRTDKDEALSCIYAYFFFFFFLQNAFTPRKVSYLHSAPYGAEL